MYIKLVAEVLKSGGGVSNSFMRINSKEIVFSSYGFYTYVFTVCPPRLLMLPTYTKDISLLNVFQI